MSQTEFDIIIISYNCCGHTLNCIKSVYETSDGLKPNVIVVDNASSDDTIVKVKEKYPEVKIIERQANSGYAAAINEGMKRTASEFVIISNADVIYYENSIEQLLNYLWINDTVGICGPQQEYPDRSWEYSYGDYPGIRVALKDLFFMSSFQRGIRKYFWYKFNIDKHPKEVDYLDGAVLAVRREAFNSVGGFDEDYFFYTEEADFCYRLKLKGWIVMFQPKARVIHIRGGSSSRLGMNEDKIRDFISSKILFCKKHYSKYHLNIYIILEQFSNCVLMKLWFIISFLGIQKKLSKEKISLFKKLHLGWKSIHN